MRKTERPAGRRFQLFLIKPSHYDDEGYVVQWLRSTMPSNSLAAVFSLAKGAAERQLLGPDLPIDVSAMDETNTRVRTRTIARRIAKTAVSVWSGLSACSRTSSRAPWTSPGRCARRESKW